MDDFAARVERLKKTIMDNPVLRRSFIALGFTNHYRSVFRQLVENERRKYYEELSMNQENQGSMNVTESSQMPMEPLVMQEKEEQPYTLVLMAELTRCRKALKAYIESVKDYPNTFSNSHHAAAHRATLDLTRCLAKWRRINTTRTVTKGRPK